MRAMRCFAAACLLALVPAASGAAGFDGLRPDPPNAPKAQAGEIRAFDAGARTLRIGGNTFLVPAALGLDFDTLALGSGAIVRYREEGGQLVAIEVQLREEFGE